MIIINSVKVIEIQVWSTYCIPEDAKRNTIQPLLSRASEWSGGGGVNPTCEGTGVHCTVGRLRPGEGG